MDRMLEVAMNAARGAALGPLVPPATMVHNSKVRRRNVKASRARAAESRRRAAAQRPVPPSPPSYRSSAGGLFGVDPDAAAEALRRNRRRPRRPDLN